MKPYFTILIVFLVICHQKTAKVDFPLPEDQLIHFVHHIIDQKKVSKIDSFFTFRYESGLFNGNVLIAEDGRIIYENAFGYADYQEKEGLNIHSVFQLASVSKPLTACAILMLYEQGLLALDDDIRKYLPDFPYQDITIRLLLTHRSGLPDYMYFTDHLWPSRKIPLTNQDIYDLMVFFKPQRYFFPNKRYNYSNTNYCLLALLIEEITGMTFAEFMHTRIFEPLEMKNTFILNYDDLIYNVNDQIVVGYNCHGKKAENSYLNGVVGDKGIYSTVRDLLLWDQALYEGKLVSLFTLNEAFKPAHPDLRANDNYGFGWRLNENNGNNIVFHSGWWKGFRTYFIRKIKEKKTVIVLTNTAQHNFISIGKLTDLL
jgi:CubicO group peptidase (beta-lactamase class C family)